jgi:hypothetical protein
MLLKKPVSVLKMSGEHPDDYGPTIAEVGKEPPAQQPEVSCGNVAAPHLLGKNRNRFDHTEPGNKELGCGVRPEPIHLAVPTSGWLCLTRPLVSRK